jgi:hypothetical protein
LAVLLLMLGVGGAVGIHYLSVTKQPDLSSSFGANPNAPQSEPPAPAGTLRSSFSGGGQAELLGISSSAQGPLWWSPGGTPLTQSFPALDLSGLKAPLGEDRTIYQFAVRITQLHGNPQSVYLRVTGDPRTAPMYRLMQSGTDPTLFVGVALLYPEQLEIPRGTIVYSTLKWTRIALDASGLPTAPDFGDAQPNQQAINMVFSPVPYSRVSEKNGKTVMSLGIEVWLGDYEYTAVAIAKDGTSHSAANRLAGLVTRGDKYNWLFDLPPSEIDHFEVALRWFDQAVQFGPLSLRPGRMTPARSLSAGSGGHNYIDDAFFSKLYGMNFGENIFQGNMPAAIAASDKLLAELNIRRQRLRTEGNAELFLVDRAMAVVTQVRDALSHNDLEAAKALLDSDSATGNCLQYAMARLAQIR